MVFDEPMTLLDLRNKKLVLDTIHTIEQPVILITHDLDHLQDFERVIVFDEGRVRGRRSAPGSDPPLYAGDGVMLSLYVPGGSFIHRAPASGQALDPPDRQRRPFSWSLSIPVHAAELVLIAGLFHAARLPWRDTVRQLRTAMILLIPIFLFHVFITDWVLGLETVLRILVLLLLAVLVTLTTKPTEMIDVLEALPRPLRHVGVNPSKASMMPVAWSFDSFPMMMREAQEILEAQRARGPRSQRDRPADAAPHQDFEDGGRPLRGHRGPRI